ncbi:AraC family transcriptional regulator [Paenibacillus sp. LHD-117]|uniref:AraC family transcriptional regulator n=1 Tax=Paenibacillus sp. LHD-117 TaxID=3071412 RepID=UPI0027DFC79A|nr:AraC family transcriptional regulator [Paenibacillus sp. LHD-117]MDQ6417899.1 AraC family transcriptional regulator [Paenibacillus sp. LHD-117]
MKRMFEPVAFGNSKLHWDYRLRNTEQYRGFYHWHQCCEMLYVHEGTGRVVVDGETFPIRPGMLFFFRPYQLHQVMADVSLREPYTRTILFFDPHVVDDLLRPFAKRYSLFRALWRGNQRTMAFDLSAIGDEIERNYDQYQWLRSRGMGEDAEEIAMMILRNLECVLRSATAPAFQALRAEECKTAGYAQQAMTWIDEHYQDSIHLDDLAAELHLSKFYLSKLFHEETGSTLKAYMTAVRIRHACRLLETTSKAIEWIGSEVGIPNTSYFVQVFKQEVGTTPLKYRTGAGVRSAPGEMKKIK